MVVRIGGMRLTQVHRHVEIVGAGSETRVEDWFVETRVACIHDDVGIGLSNQGNNVGFIPSIDARSAEPPGIIKFVDRSLRRLNRNVGKRER